jgi:peptide/nickel transport system permease protein
VVGSIGRRLLTAALTLLVVTWVVFALAQLLPGDALTIDAGDESLAGRLPPERVEELRRQYRLDEPLPKQYGLWLVDLLRGELGRSFHDHRPVREKIASRIGITLTLNVLSLALMVALAVPIGAVAAWRPGSWVDRVAGPATYALYAVPVFWAALLLQIVFAVRLDWLPLYGLASTGGETSGAVARVVDRGAHLVLPVLCLTYGGLAYLSRFVRATLVENLSGDAVRAARARGLSWVAVLFRHGFRQAAVPMLTLAGFLLPALVGGSVIVESVFAIPGLGRLFVDAVFQRDIPVIMALTLLSGTATLAGIVAADVAYTIFDPRVRDA